VEEQIEIVADVLAGMSERIETLTARL